MIRISLNQSNAIMADVRPASTTVEIIDNVEIMTAMANAEPIQDRCSNRREGGKRLALK